MRELGGWGGWGKGCGERVCDSLLIVTLETEILTFVAIIFSREAHMMVVEGVW